MILERAFRYPPSGELASVNDALRGHIEYGYDAEGRLLRHHDATQRLPHTSFRYDAADNRLSRWQHYFRQYDSWGNLIFRRDGIYEQYFTYDAENRLIQAKGTGPQGRFKAQYDYDALGRCIGKTVTAEGETNQTRFIWQGFRLLQEQSDGISHTYVYDPVDPYSPLARIDHHANADSGEIFWFSTDLNSAPLEVTDADGNLCWSGQYSNFGEVRGQSHGFKQLTHCDVLAHQPLRYAGQYADTETGLHYNLFRYYDPQIGRFTVQDPIGLAGGLNLYQYAPNPLGWVDPWGLSGTYGFERANSIGGEVNHIPAYGSYKGIDGAPSHYTGMAYPMETIDHRAMNSTGSSALAKEWRSTQKSYIKQGRWDKAMEMDILDSRERFKNKYSDGMKRSISAAENKGLISKSQAKRLKKMCG